MSMKKMLAVVAAVSLAAAPAFAANPFSDVPMNHWAYDAVEQLSAKGILEGYPNGTFKGNKSMTRYEIATMVARMMANGGASGADLVRPLAVCIIQCLNNVVCKFTKNLQINELLRLNLFRHRIVRWPNRQALFLAFRQLQRNPNNIYYLCCSCNLANR